MNHLSKNDGSINQAAAAKAFGIHQPTLLRILSGKSAEPKSNAIQGILCSYFGIQPAQLRGEAPLEIEGALTGNPTRTLASRLTKPEELLLSLYRSLSPTSQKTAIRVLAALKG